MIINANNLGTTDPIIQLTGKYLTTSGNALYYSTEKSYYLDSSAVTLLKVGITKFDTNLSVSSAKLKLKIKGVQEGGAIFKLFTVDSSAYSKSKATEVALGTLIDVIHYNGKASKYGGQVEDIIEFDLTKYLYNIAKSSTNTLYFAITCDSSNYRLFSFEELVNSEVLFSMQLNSLKGLDTVYEFDQEEVGFAGVSSINLANGKMIHKVEAIQTPSEDNPAVFHMFFNKEQTPRVKILGENWTYSGDYDYSLDRQKGIITLIDPSQKILFFKNVMKILLKKYMA